MQTKKVRVHGDVVTSSKVGRPKGEDTSRIMIYLPVAMADAVRELVEREGMTLTGFYERLTREELTRRGIES